MNGEIDIKTNVEPTEPIDTMSIDDLRDRVKDWPDFRKVQLASLIESYERTGVVVGLTGDEKTGIQVVRHPLSHENAIRRACGDLIPIVERETPKG